MNSFGTSYRFQMGSIKTKVYYSALLITKSVNCRKEKGLSFRSKFELMCYIHNPLFVLLRNFKTKTLVVGHQFFR